MTISRTSSQARSFLLLLLVFAITFAGYLITPRSSQVASDPRWSIHLALSIIREGNIDLDEYQQLIPSADLTVLTSLGHKYSLYPFGAPLLAVPFLWVYNLFNSNTFATIESVHPAAQEFIASFITALTAVLLYLIARLSLSVKQSLLVAFIFAFCTSAWSTTSRALWQHGPSMLVLSLALYLLLLSKEKPWLIQYVSLPLAFSYVIRPSNAISIVIISFYVFLYFRKYFLNYIVWSLGIALPFFLFNYTTYKALLPDYYFRYGAFFVPTVERLAGPLISPSRGVFIYTPIFLFSLFGGYLKLKNFRLNHPGSTLDLLLVCIIIAHSLFISSWKFWYGGHSIGPRMLSDMIPLMIYFLLPAIPIVTTAHGQFAFFRAAFFGCLIFSFFIQFRGAADQSMTAWNYTPTNIDTDRARLWDWGDPQFLRGVNLWGRLFPPKLGASSDSIDLYCAPGEQQVKCKTSLEIFDRRWQPFKWEANSPPEARVVPVKGYNEFERSRLAVHLIGEDYLPGVYNLGELKISAARTGKLTSTDLMFVPIILHIEPLDQK